MKRFSQIALIIFVILLGMTPAVHAAFCDAMQTCTYATQEAADAAYGNTPENASIGNSLTPAQYDAAYTAQNGATAQQEIAKASVAPAQKEVDPNAAYNSVMQKILELFAWLLGVAALTLNYAVYYTVVTMGAYVGNLSAIGVTWTILRDIGNIMLIFGFLAVGITTILNVDWYGGGKKMLPMMLIAAVFLNFSLFISKAVIDTGNLFATQFYTQINGNKPPQKPSMTMSTIAQEGISNKIMNKLGMQTLYGDGTVNKQIFDKNNPWLVGFMGILLFIVTAFVMFSLAFVLIARFVILIFLIILSPIGFAGLAVPQLAKRAGQWWIKLFEQTITAPVLLLMLYIALSVIVDPRFLTGFDLATITGGASTGFVGNANLVGFGSFILSFLVAMGLLIAVVIQSKNLSAFGAGAVMKAVGGAKSFALGSVKFAGRGALGAGRWTANRSAGRISHMASQGLMRISLGQTQLGRLAATGLAKGGAGFKEAKEKTLKTHEEYVKSVGAAIEAKHLPAIADARLERANAEKAIEPQTKAATAAKEEKAAAAEKVKSLKNAIPHLEQVVNDNMKKNIIDVGAINARNEARAALPLAEKEEKSADEKVRTTSAVFTKASEDVGLAAAQNKEKVATEKLAEAKREAAVAYGESVKTAFMENPLTWTLSGPGGSSAGNKIIADTLKKMTESEEALDKLTKAIKKQAGISDDSAKTGAELNKVTEDLAKKKEKEAEEKKSSAPPTPPPAPPTP